MTLQLSDEVQAGDRTADGRTDTSEDTKHVLHVRVKISQNY